MVSLPLRRLRFAVAACALSLLLSAVGAGAQRPNRAPTHGQYGFLHENMVVLFQGGAITEGGRPRSGAGDASRVLGQGYPFLIAAEIGSTVPERKIKFLNRAVGGERLVELAARWHEDTLQLKPDILSILVGLNNNGIAPSSTGATRGPLSAEEYEAVYDKLIAQTVAALPTTRIVLGEPFLLPAGRHQAMYADEMVDVKKRQAAVQRIADKYHLPLIHYQQAFNDALNRAPADYWTTDGQHPTYAGYGLMAKLWLRVTSEAWAAY